MYHSLSTTSPAGNGQMARFFFQKIVEVLLLNGHGVTYRKLLSFTSIMRQIKPLLTHRPYELYEIDRNLKFPGFRVFWISVGIVATCSFLCLSSLFNTARSKDYSERLSMPDLNRDHTPSVFDRIASVPSKGLNVHLRCIHNNAHLTL